METILKLRSISQSFEQGKHDLTVLKDIDLEVKQGEFLMVLGPSGSGKSTLLRIMAGLLQPTSGTVETSKDISQSFIFQDFALFPWLTVRENIGFGLKMHGVEPTEGRTRIEEQIQRMGLKGFEKSFPRELSGGMKQRVGIARALAMKPNIVFLDEPFSALDSFTAKKLRADLVDIWQEQKLTLVMVTHLIDEALQLGDRIAVLSTRPAKVERVFHNLLPRPRNNRSEKFFEMVDSIESTIKL